MNNTTYTLHDFATLPDEDKALEQQTISYKQFVEMVAATRLPVDWRTGQFWFNAVNCVRPDIANALAGSLCDCFYRDENIEKFLERVHGMW